jgi:Fur family transcriptional regulator, iron response regulator
MTQDRYGKSECGADVRRRLTEAGIKPTPQRLEVAAVLLSRPQHLCADELHRTLREHGRPVSKATVYNALSLFVKHGLVRAVFVDARRVFYDSTPGPHHHFFNEDTGELHDLDPAALRISGVPALPQGTRASSVDLVVRVRNKGMHRG